jgi:hypothetical protein
MSRQHFTSVFRIAVFVALALNPAAQATSIYTVAMNTTGFAGRQVAFAFDLTGGDAAAGNNSVLIDHFSTNGQLGGLSSVVLTDTLFFNEQLRFVTFGTFFNFTVTLTENRSAPGVDDFSFSLLSPPTLWSLFSTSDPIAGSLFAVDITGADGGNASTFVPVDFSGISWQVTRSTASPAPDAGVSLGFLVVSLGMCALLGTRRRWISRRF